MFKGKVAISWDYTVCKIKVCRNSAKGRKGNKVKSGIIFEDRLCWVRDTTDPRANSSKQIYVANKSKVETKSNHKKAVNSKDGGKWNKKRDK